MMAGHRDIDFGKVQPLGGVIGILDKPDSPFMCMDVDNYDEMAGMELKLEGEYDVFVITDRSLSVTSNIFSRIDARRLVVFELVDGNSINFIGRKRARFEGDVTLRLLGENKFSAFFEHYNKVKEDGLGLILKNFSGNIDMRSCRCYLWLEECNLRSVHGLLTPSHLYLQNTKLELLVNCNIDYLHSVKSSLSFVKDSCIKEFVVKHGVDLGNSDNELFDNVSIDYFDFDLNFGGVEDKIRLLRMIEEARKKGSLTMREAVYGGDKDITLVIDNIDDEVINNIEGG